MRILSYKGNNEFVSSIQIKPMIGSLSLKALTAMLNNINIAEILLGIALLKWAKAGIEAFIFGIAALELTITQLEMREDRVNLIGEGSEPVCGVAVESSAFVV